MFASTNIIGRSDRSFQFNTGWTKFQYQIGGTAFTTAAGNVTNTLTRTQAGSNYCYGGSTSTNAVGFVVNQEVLDTSSATKGSIRWDQPLMWVSGYNANQPTELTIDELRISTTTFKSAAWLQYEQKQLLDHANYVTYGPEA